MRSLRSVMAWRRKKSRSIYRKNTSVSQGKPWGFIHWAKAAVLEKQSKYLSQRHGGSIVFVTLLCASEFYLRAAIFFRLEPCEYTFLGLFAFLNHLLKQAAFLAKWYVSDVAWPILCLYLRSLNVPKCEVWYGGRWNFHGDECQPHAEISCGGMWGTHLLEENASRACRKMQLGWIQRHWDCRMMLLGWVLVQCLSFASFFTQNV